MQTFISSTSCFFLAKDISSFAMSLYNAYFASDGVKRSLPRLRAAIQRKGRRICCRKPPVQSLCLDSHLAVLKLWLYAGSWFWSEIATSESRGLTASTRNGPAGPASSPSRRSVRNWLFIIVNTDCSFTNKRKHPCCFVLKDISQLSTMIVQAHWNTQ